MSDKYFVDTNVFLRFFLKDNNEQYKIAEKLLKKAKQRKLELWIIPQIIFEINYVLASVYKMKKAEAANFIKSILSWDYIRIGQKRQIKEAILVYCNTTVDLIDIFLYILAKEKKCDVFSFDKDFEKIKKRVG